MTLRGSYGMPLRDSVTATLHVAESVKKWHFCPTSKYNVAKPAHYITQQFVYGLSSHPFYFGSFGVRDLFY